MELRLHAFDLPLKHTFTISRGSIDIQQTLVAEGNKARQVAATRMNERSSRSHAVLMALVDTGWAGALEQPPSSI